MNSNCLAGSCFGDICTFTAFCLDICNSGRNGVFRKNRTVNFHWRQGQFFSNVLVLDLTDFFKGLALDHFGNER